MTRNHHSAAHDAEVDGRFCRVSDRDAHQQAVEDWILVAVVPRPLRLMSRT